MKIPLLRKGEKTQLNVCAESDYVMNRKPSGWTEHKELAKAFGVSYSTYYRRIQEGMNPVDAATLKPIDPVLNLIPTMVRRKDDERR